MQKNLKVVKMLRAGIRTVHNVAPSTSEFRNYGSAVNELDSVLGKLPRATYSVRLQSMGNHHNLFLDISGMNTRELETQQLEEAVETIFCAVERTEWRPKDPGREHEYEDVKRVVRVLRKNDGVLKDLDSIPFFLYDPRIKE